MKKTATLLLLIVGFSFNITSCTQSNSQSAAVVNARQETTIAKDVPVDEFKNLIEKNNAIILDVRKPEEVAAGHLKGSVNIDFYREDFKSEVAKLDKTKPYLVYCRSGVRSSKTMAMMQEMGFTQVYNLIPGINGWISAGLPVEK